MSRPYMPACDEEPDSASIRALLDEAGWNTEYALTGLHGGRNNRCYRLDSGNKVALLKWYFQHPDDLRDRLAAEFAFCHFCWNNGIRETAEPIACDRAGRLGLFSFLNGRPMRQTEVTRASTLQAMKFLAHVNSHREDARALDLPRASEACFSVGEHLECIERRVSQTQRIGDQSAYHREALALATNRLEPAWKKVAREVQQRCAEVDIGLDQVLPIKARCISPSDFGFHNALRTDSGQIRFIDFEYAGWDDPAKLVNDFACQVQRPVPAELHVDVLDAVQEIMRADESFRVRTALLAPAFRTKWCCIALNDFLTAGGDRRAFGESVPDDERFERQLRLAEQLLDRLGEPAFTR